MESKNLMRTSYLSFPIVSSLLLAASLLPAVVTPSNAAAATKPDVLVFSNGDTLTGKLDHEADGNVFFKSDNAGTVKVAWAKLKSIRTEGPFAVIETGTPVGRKKANLDVPVGTLSVDGDTLTVTTANGAQQIPVKSIAYLVDQPTYEKNVTNGQGLLQGINGTVAAGASTVNSTQNSVSINSAVALTRAVPPVTWMPARQRTVLNFASNYGRVSEPNTPTVKTNILHGGLEEDEYFSPRFYLLQQAMYDHNFSQGLDLQQLYGLGAGFTPIKNARQELDLTAVIAYTRQQFSGNSSATPPVAATSTNLVGLDFADNYTRKFARKIVFTEVASVNTPWNSPSDYSSNVAVGANFPVYKNVGFSVGVVDSYLNNPPTGFKGNSVQFNTALTYTIHR
jgi:hypothetical protein